MLKPDGTLWLNIADSYCGTGDKGNYKDPKYAEGRNGQSVSRNRKLNGVKSKDLIGIPWMLAFELRRRGWYLRQDIIWHKPNPMPESVKEPAKPESKRRYEYEFNRGKTQLTPRPRNGPNTAGMKQYHEKRNKRDVWSVTVKPTKEAHFATYPPDLIEPCILAGSRRGGVVLDPFFGSGTTGVVATQLGRGYIGIELNPEYIEIAKRRLANVQIKMQ